MTTRASPPPDVDTPDGGPPCAEYGQICTVSSDCCNGIPCVGGLVGATDKLKTGDTVRVDGAKGTVEILATV